MGPPRICVLAQLQHETGLGDMILRNSLLALVKRRYPDSSVTLIVGADHAARFAEFLQRHSLADEVMSCPAHPPGAVDPSEEGTDAGSSGEVQEDFLPCAEFDPSPFSESWPGFVKELRAGAFDICVLDPGTTWLHADTARGAGIPVRIGVYTGHPEDEHLTRAASVFPRAGGMPDLSDIHVACAAALDVPVPIAGTVRAPFPYRAEGPEPALPHPRIAVHVGGGHAWNRRWPLQNYVELCERLLAGTNGSLVLVGADDERQDNQFLMENLGARWAGRVWNTGAGSLARTATVLAGCDLFTGSDSAPMHMAVALGLPTVAIYGPCDGIDFWGDVLPDHTALSHRWPCHELPHSFWAREFARCNHRCRYSWRPDAPEYPRCIADISVGEVSVAVERVLAR